MLYTCVPHNVATTLWKLRDIYIQRKYNVILQRCEHVEVQRCTLRCDNVAGTSFSQRSEKNLLATLYNVVFTLCVCWDIGLGYTGSILTFTHIITKGFKYTCTNHVI